jgi:hypothetical protein
MTAEEHNKTLATLWFIYGAMHGLTLFGLMVLGLLFKFASTAGDLISSFWMFISVMTFILLLFVVALLPLLVALGFAKRRPWVKPLAIAVSIVSLINIPIGTALGIYTIKFLRSEAGVSLYGGRASSATDAELADAMRGAQPLMNWANKSKS